MPFMGMALGTVAAQTRLITSSFDTTISRGANSFESLTCVSGSDATEAFVVPAGALANVGDMAMLDIYSSIFHNEGTNRTLNSYVYSDGTLIVQPAVGPTIVSAAGGNKAGRHSATIIRTGALTANVILSHWHGVAAAAGSLPQGTQYGSMQTNQPAHMIAEGVAWDPDVAHTIKLATAWAVTSALLACNPRMRFLYVMNY